MADRRKQEIRNEEIKNIIDSDIGRQLLQTIKEKNKKTYPAIFKYSPEEKYHYSVTFPDLPGCITEGRTIDEATEMAREALALHLFGMEEDEEEIPSPSGFVHTKENEALVLITVNMIAFRTAMNSKSVKKTLTIPASLNYAAEKEGVNFSQVLQTALKQYLNIK
jgi:predicted RNase H-like HicB family nuclease